MDREKVIKGLKCLSALEKDRYITVFCENCKYGTESYCTPIIAKDAISLLKELEAKIEQLNRFVNGFSRDAMPVVRCKDCKSWDIKKGHCKDLEFVDDHNWYCADGERKEGR